MIETYQVEEHDGEKLIHYNGYSWYRDDDELPYAATEGTFCYVGIGEHNLARATAALEFVNQYQYDMTLAEFLEYEASWKSYPMLHMDDVDDSTPCGLYWFEY